MHPISWAQSHSTYKTKAVHFHFHCYEQLGANALAAPYTRGSSKTTKLPCEPPERFNFASSILFHNLATQTSDAKPYRLSVCGQAQPTIKSVAFQETSQRDIQFSSWLSRAVSSNLSVLSGPSSNAPQGIWFCQKTTDRYKPSLTNVLHLCTERWSP